MGKLTQAINDSTEPEIRRALTRRGEPAYRAKQISEWLCQRRAKSFDEMTNLPAALRQALAKAFTIARLEPTRQIVSPEDGTTKAALALPDGSLIETVFLPHPRGATLCISTQVGCAFNCRFCATGKIGLKRNLTPGEIVDQVLFAKQAFAFVLGPERGAEPARPKAGPGEPTAEPAGPTAEPGRTTTDPAPPAPDERPFSNVVFMGMGEPLANYDNVVKAIEILIKEVGIGSRRITVSTAGVADKIMHLADLPYELGLAISLNSPSDETRRQIMPVAGKTPLAAVMAAARYYCAKKGRMVTFEHVLIPALNDSVRDAHAVASLTRDIPAKINLIALNPFPGCPYERPDETSVRRFQSVLRERGKKVMLRRSLGCDILAGCGQLGQGLRKPGRL